jgi:hypothetical protein
MDGNALHILNKTTKAILDAESDENLERERYEKIEEAFVNLYPCSCGHCSSCGGNFVPTPDEQGRWAREDEEEGQRWEKIDGEWFKVW